MAASKERLVSSQEDPPIGRARRRSHGHCDPGDRRINHGSGGCRDALRVKATTTSPGHALSGKAALVSDILAKDELYARDEEP